tara:strand:- start:760 stop:1083 length:324 start_codon:yes stop_codon:yes gene_type:complete
VSANSYNVTSSNGAGCSQNESTGRSIETGMDFNTATEQATVSVRYKVEFGKGSLKKIDCGSLYAISVAKQQLQLDKSLLELELLKAQIAAVNRGETAAPAVTNANDW